jgi:hypothetical protein
MTQKIICPICKKKFTPIDGKQKCCGDRCRYIKLYINRPAAVQMGREAAIEHYGKLFDDPLRPIGKSKYMPVLRWIHAWCQKNKRTTFTEREIAEGYIGELEWYTLAAIRRRHGVIDVYDRGDMDRETVWQFVLPKNETKPWS